MFLVPLKGMSFIPLVFQSAFTENSFTSPLGLTSTDEISITGIVFHQSKTLNRSVSSYFALFPGQSRLFSE